MIVVHANYTVLCLSLWLLSLCGKVAVSLSVLVSGWLSVSPSVWLSVCLASCQAISLVGYQAVSLAVSVSVCVSLSGCLSGWLSGCFSACLIACLSLCVAEWPCGRGLHFDLFSVHGPWTRPGKSAERGNETMTESAIMPGATKDTSAGNTQSYLMELQSNEQIIWDTIMGSTSAECWCVETALKYTKGLFQSWRLWLRKVFNNAISSYCN